MTLLTQYVFKAWCLVKNWDKFAPPEYTHYTTNYPGKQCSPTPVNNVASVTASHLLYNQFWWLQSSKS